MINRRRGVAPEPRPPFVADSFTDTGGTSLVDHVGEIGAAWTAHMDADGGPPVISDTNELRRGGGGGSTVCYASGVPLSADYEVSADFRWAGAPAGYAGIWARLDPAAANGYLLQYEGQGGPARWSLYSRTPSTYTYFGGANAADPGRATLRVVGDEITVIVDGVTIISVTNADHTDPGCVGVRFDPAGGDVIWLDNLSAT